VTPEATLDVVDRLVPGLAEAMRAAGMAKTPHALLSRAVAGIRGRTLIVNLPGSPRGVEENLTAILPALPHGLAILTGRAGECGRPVQP
jgi:molybdopterin biosynthesis enzyme MoaB